MKVLELSVIALLVAVCHARTIEVLEEVEDRCLLTGPTCLRRGCEGMEVNGYYQYCGRCDIFMHCIDQETTLISCPPAHVWDDRKKLCTESGSITCEECYQGDPLPQPTTTTTSTTKSTTTSSTASTTTASTTASSTATTTTTTAPTPQPKTVCGTILQPLDDKTDDLPEGWTAMCYITSEMSYYRNYECRDLLQNLPDIGNAQDLLDHGGNFGCWRSSEGYDAPLEKGCRNFYQQGIDIGGCADCDILGVCVRYP